jgi:hypothetical protein
MVLPSLRSPVLGDFVAVLGSLRARFLAPLRGAVLGGFAARCSAASRPCSARLR